MIVYTASDGIPVAPQRKWYGIRMIAFSNAPVPDPWERWPLPRHDDPCRAAKRPKILPWDFLPDWDRCLWIDANLILRKNPSNTRFPIAIHQHRHRDCVYDEAQVCILLGKDNADTINGQMERYRQSGYLEHAGLWECGVIYRDNRADVESLCRDWWAEIETGSRRDQLSLPFVVQNYPGIRPRSLGDHIWKSGWVKKW